MKAKKFEQAFDDGADITASLDLSKARRVQQAQKRVNVDFPTWMVDSLDREASKLGVTRQSVIKVCWPSALRRRRRMRLYNGHLKLRRTAELKVRFTPSADIPTTLLPVPRRGDVAKRSASEPWRGSGS